MRADHITGAFRVYPRTREGTVGDAVTIPSVEILVQVEAVLPVGVEVDVEKPPAPRRVGRQERDAASRGPRRR